ncbi:hypothetical protein L596_020468 [Steinernema carpocapsae]|uniref:Serpin domain-containing protein n=1 Tax=Steinernema carpocapsae TaxID=34508 RepID=A0A4U5MTM1_STECR|nr:hypothetical protein L596_020468 [Steinernema carpocapsae]
MENSWKSRLRTRERKAGDSSRPSTTAAPINSDLYDWRDYVTGWADSLPSDDDDVYQEKLAKLPKIPPKTNKQLREEKHLQQTSIDSKINNSLFCFALKVLKTKQGQTTVLSPLSMGVALSAILNGTKGRSLEQVKNAVFDGLHVNNINAHFASLLHLLTELSMGTAVFVDKSSTVKGNFKLHMDCYPGVVIENVNFQKNATKEQTHVNSVVEEMTKQDVKDFLPAGMLNDTTSVVIASAVHVRARFLHQCVSDSTVIRPFSSGNNVNNIPVLKCISSGEERPDHTKRPDFYKKGGEERLKPTHLSTPDFDYVDFCLRFGEPEDCTGDYRFFVICPKLGSLEDLLDRFILKMSIWSETVDDALLVDFLSLEVPKFKVQSSMDLRNVLESLGIKDLFDISKADFSNLASGKPKLDFLMHKVGFFFVQTNVLF